MTELPTPWHERALARTRGLDALSDAWRAAAPFPHLVFDELVSAEGMRGILAVLEEEPVEHYDGEIFAFDASAPEPATPALAQLRRSFAEVFAPSLSRITDKKLTRADMRAYAYREGHYLLPHSDHQTGVGRSLAFAYYLATPEPPTGGELELFRCATHDGEVVETTSARLITPRPNRLVVFDVSDVSLHQVREVTGGLRISLAGWLYP